MDDIVLRNFPIITLEEQDILKQAEVVFAGCGAIGQSALITLVRMGLGSVVIADPDVIEPTNINRQLLAFQRTVGCHKTELAAVYTQEINPQTRVRVYPDGVTLENVSKLLEGAALVVEGIDVTSPSAVVLVHREARRRGISIISAVELGFGMVGCLYTPTGFSIEEQMGYSPQTPLQTIEAQGVPLSAFVPILPSYVSMADFEKVISGEIPAPAIAPAAMLAGAWLATTGFCLMARPNDFKPVAMPFYTWIDLVLGTCQVRNFQSDQNPTDIWGIPKLYSMSWTPYKIPVLLNQKKEEGDKKMSAKVPVIAVPIVAPVGVQVKKIIYSPAATESERLARLRVVTKVYLERGYITKDSLDSEGLYRDGWENLSTGYVAEFDGLPVGSIRMIPRTGRGLPIDGLQLFEQSRQMLKGIGFEISQLAKTKGSPPQVALGLLRCIVVHARQNGNNRLVAVIDKHVHQLLEMLHIPMEQIGESQMHLGSMCTLVSLDVRGVIAYLDALNSNVVNYYGLTNRQLASFLDRGSFGEFDIESGNGFSWYVGP